ncbi:hypothetical protein JCM14635_36770 [Megalodesulfovibrio paquesii]
MLPLVGVDALHQSGPDQAASILLVFLQDDARNEIEDMLEAAGAAFPGQLAIWIVEETALADLMRRYFVSGTPTFLLLRHKIEAARLLGRIDAHALHAFLRRHLPQGTTVSA